MTQNQIQYWNLEELKRSHQANEALNLATLQETQRANQAREKIDLSKLDETIRSNKANENISVRNLILQSQNLAESIRTHQANEAIGWGNVQVQQARANSQRLVDEANALLQSDENSRRNILNVQETAKLKAEIESINRQNSVFGQGNVRQWMGSMANLIGQLAKLFS